jgi:hypothetical protein
VADWLEKLVDDYNLDAMNFLDDELLANRRFIGELCNEVIKRGLHKRIVWECQARVKSVNDEIINLIKSAGCGLVRFGVESGSDTVLRFLKDDSSRVEDARRAISLCGAHGLHTFGSFIIGSPDETMSDILETIRFIEESGLNSAACFAMVPYPGTKVFEICHQRGYFEAGITWSDYIVEKNSRDITPRFIVRNRDFTSEQLHFITRYIDQNVVERLNRGLPGFHGSHQENLEKICAGDRRLSNAPLGIRMAYSRESINEWCGTQYKRLSYIAHLPLSRIGAGVLKHVGFQRKT